MRIAAKVRASTALLAIVASVHATGAYAQPGADVEREHDREAIRTLLEQQTRLAREGDYQSYIQVWGRGAHVVRMTSDGQRTAGWDALSEQYRNSFDGSRQPTRDYVYQPSGWHIHVNGNTAWTLNDQHETGSLNEIPFASDVWNVRILEKQDGEWKVVFLMPGLLSSGTTTLKGEEVWERTIAHHDPGNRWDSFDGKVNAITTWATGASARNDLELRNADRFYQTTRISNRGRVDGGVCFQNVDGNATPSVAEIERYDIGCDRARLMRAHHAQHFGFPMELKRSGARVEEEVMRTVLRGAPVHALKFSGDPEVVTHPYYGGSWTLFIDPATFEVRGVRVQNALFKDITCTFDGQLEVSGVMMAQAKTCYSEGAYYMTETFIPSEQ